MSGGGVGWEAYFLLGCSSLSLLSSSFASSHFCGRSRKFGNSGDLLVFSS
jgi:hypothetical protein